MAETIAERMRALRQERGWSKQELARRIGGKNPRTVVQRWEGGEVVPSPASVQKLAEVFGVPVTDVDPSGSAYKHTGPRLKPREVDNPAEVGRIPYSLPLTTAAEGPMKDLIDQYLGALGVIPAEHRAAFVRETRLRAVARVQELEDAGHAPVKQRRVAGKL